MSRTALVILAGAALLLPIACNPLAASGQLPEVIRVESLWPDVAPFPGGVPAQGGMPAELQTSIEAVWRPMALGGGETANRIEFTAFVIDQGIDEVARFYTPERMSADGWTSGGAPCRASANGPLTGGCGFVKDGEDAFPMLLIDVWDEGRQTLLYFIRIGVEE